MSAPDRAEIRELVENRALWRDAGDWERFATVWPRGGVMSATWFHGPAAEFIRASREGFERGVNILHFLGGTTVDVADDRAIAQTKMTILQRAEVDVRLVLPGLTGEALEQLYAEGRAWLSGQPANGSAPPAPRCAGERPACGNG